MALDSLTLYHLIRELSPRLVGARVDRVHQPEKDEIHLSLRPKKPEGDTPSASPGSSTLRLLLNAGSTAARLHLTETTKKNPTAPPMFCMILRKHLEGARLLDICQTGLDRIVTLVFQNYNERGDLQEYHLCLEIMGKHSNLILINPQTGAILDGIRRYSHALSRHREVLPGRPYIAPPSQDKLLPMDETSWTQAMTTHTPPSGTHLITDEAHFITDEAHFITDEAHLDLPLHKLLLKTFTGMSPELAQELVARAGLDNSATLDKCGHYELSRLYQGYAELLLRRETFTPAPTLYYSPKDPQAPPTAFTFTPYAHYADKRSHSVSTLNEALERFYEIRLTAQKTEAARGSLRRVIQDAGTHAGKKAAIYQDTIAKAHETLPARKMGELIMANLYRIPPQSSSVTVEDYLQVEDCLQEETEPSTGGNANSPNTSGSAPNGSDSLPLITLTLDPLLSPVANAQLYYRRYNKAKAALEKTAPLLQSAQTEYTYLQSLLISIQLAQTPQEIMEIRTELINQKYIAKTHTSHKPQKPSKAKKQKNKTAAEPPSRPHHYTSSAGQTIIVGRNNTQNDRMTWRDAQPHDLWLHVKNIPGSHVIVPLTENQEFPDDDTLLEAAALAIHFSQAARSSHVPVDYTHVAQIKKPNGARPGMVVYEQNWTLYLTPDPSVIERLLATETDQTDKTRQTGPARPTENTSHFRA